MEKMTVREIESKLYIETLREKFQDRDFMFTTIGEKRWQKILDKLEITKDVSDSFIERLFNDVKDEDFFFALLFAYWNSKFADNKSRLKEAIDSYIIQELEIDMEKVCTEVLIDSFSPYFIHNRRLRFFFKETKEIIKGYDNWNGKDTLELDTDFFEDSTKIMSEGENFIISTIIRDLRETSSKVLHYEDDYTRDDKEAYTNVIAQLSSCKEQTPEGIDSFLTKLYSLVNKNGDGRVIIIDNNELLASDEMYGFRKRIIDENLLDTFISDAYHIFDDTYILRVSGQNRDSLFHILHGNRSMGENILDQHHLLSQSDMVSIDYDLKSASQLVPGQNGRGYSFNELFSTPKSGVDKQKVSGVYPVFQMKDFPNDFSGATKHASDLERCEISGYFHIVTEDKAVLFIGDDKVCACYIEASQDQPIYVGGQFIVLDLKTDVLDPCYLQILCSKGVLEKAFDRENFERKYFRYSDVHYDYETNTEVLITPEKKINLIKAIIPIPSKESQRKDIMDAQFIYASSTKRQRALETMLAEKTWLNEEHIRNIKHRIGNELVPIQNDIEAFSKLFQTHPEGLTLETIRGKNERVSEILDRLNRDISRVNNSLQDLTRTVDKANLKPVNIVDVVREFTTGLTNNGNFKLTIDVPNERIDVNGSLNMINSILRNIVDNAVRHGFVDKERKDYAIKIAVTKDGNGNCVLDVKNNGEPMSQLAQDNYFKRGSVAGITGHSGIGGADVKDTANVMGGEATLPICEDGWSVCVRISLPILNSERV